MQTGPRPIKKLVIPCGIFSGLFVFFCRSFLTLLDAVHRTATHPCELGFAAFSIQFTSSKTLRENFAVCIGQSQCRSILGDGLCRSGISLKPCVLQHVQN